MDNADNFMMWATIVVVAAFLTFLLLWSLAEKVAIVIGNRRTIRAGVRKAERERVARIKRFEAIKTKLDGQVEPARPGMKPVKKVLYQNPETSTLVYEVLTSNTSVTNHPNNWTFWVYFLVGNDRGWTMSRQYTELASIVKGVSEDTDEVSVRIAGAEASYLDITVQVGDLTFKKADFKPYMSQA